MAVSAHEASYCAYDKLYSILLHMHGKITYIFDCWTFPVVHLLLLERAPCLDLIIGRVLGHKRGKND